MAAQAGHADTRPLLGPQAEVLGRRHVHAKLVLLPARGDIGMRLRPHAGIDPQGHPCPHFQSRSPFAEQAQLALRLTVEQEDARAQGVIHFLARFADSRKNHPAGFPARLQNAEQLSAGNNVKARFPARQQPQHA